MTTGTHPETGPRLLTRWAASQLDLPAAVPAEKARTAFMGRLAGEDFVPPLRWQQAFRVLCADAASPAVGAQSMFDEENRLRPEVEEFAAKFFTFEIAERKERWLALMDECKSFRILTGRLLALEAGLDESANFATGNPTVQEVTDYVRELFVLSPQSRAFRRQEILYGMGAEKIAVLGKVAQQLVTLNPTFTAFEPDFLGQLGSWNQRQRERPQRRAKRKDTPAEPAVEPDGSSPKWNWSWLWLIFIVLSLVRACTSGFHSNSNNSSWHQVTPFPTAPVRDDGKMPDIGRLLREGQDPETRFKTTTTTELRRTLEKSEKDNGKPDRDWPPGDATRRLLGGPEISKTEAWRQYEEALRAELRKRGETVLPPVDPSVPKPSRPNE